MTIYATVVLRVALAAWASLLLGTASPASAGPDLRQGRTAGTLTVYPDDTKRNVFYYAPGDLAIATRENGAPDVHLLHARYTGSTVTRDQGTAVFRSIFTVRVVLNGPTPTQLAEARSALTKQGMGSVELRPLPIRRVETAIVYASIAPVDATASATAAGAGEPAATPLPAGHFEPGGDKQPPRNGFWSQRVYTLRLAPEDAQLLTSALERGQVAISVGYAFMADGIGPDQPLQELAGSPALVAELKQLIAPTAHPEGSAPAESRPASHVVRAGAIGITADLARWPQIVRRVDINESVPPGYAALDIHCYDFNQGTDPVLYEKQVEIEARGVGGAPVTITATFTSSEPDLYARSLRFPVAVRLDRPYRFRVVHTMRDGTSTTTPWLEQTSWTNLLDVTTQGDRR